MQTMKARLLVARNIHAILTARKESQSDLARWCRKKSSWMNKILAGRRPLHIDDFDRVADFLGISVYQLFVPGVSALTERRKSADRRHAQDRRRGHVERIIELRRPPAIGERHDPVAVSAAAAALPEGVRRLITDTAQKLDLLLRETEPGGQVAQARKALPKSRARRRAAGGSDAPKS